MIQGQFETSKLERVTFGRPAETALAAEVEAIGAERVMVVASASLAKASGIVERIEAALPGKIALTFTDMPAHTPRPAVLTAAQMARDGNVDLLVSIGGGSQIDGVKAIQLCLTENLKTDEELAPYARSASQPVPLKKPGSATIRSVAIPTTLSGAEYGTTAGVVDPGTHQKEGYDAPDLVPVSVILDAELCKCTPLDLWLSTAVRSIDHAAEGLCSAQTYPYLDAQFIAAARLLSGSLRHTKQDPDDLGARMASLQAVWTVSAGIGRVHNGASHGLGYILGALGVPHGHTSCVLLPAVLAWNASVNADRQALISEALGRAGMSAADAVRELITDLGQPTRLSEVGVHADAFDRIASFAVNHPVVQSNPRPITSKDDVLEILNLAA
jgi:maleylacetate reductase